MDQEPLNRRNDQAGEPAPQPWEPRVITATDVAGSRFTGGTGPAPEPERQAAVIAQAQSTLPMVVQSLYAEKLRSVEPRADEAGEPYFALTDQQGRDLTLRVDFIPLPTGTVARTYVNPTSDHHIVQLSDRMDPQQVGRALSHEVGEILSVRERAMRAAAGDPEVAGVAPPRQDLLVRGQLAEAERGFRLTDEDLGRVGELNYLAARVHDASLGEDQRGEARGELSALIDHAGLRPQAPAGSEQHARELQAADLRLNTIEPHLTVEARGVVTQLAVPVEQLGAADAADLQAFRSRAEYTLPLGNGPPMPGLRPDGSPIPREELASAAAEAAEQRTRVSSDTLTQLRAEAAANGEWPTRQVVIGGGASLAGRDPDALLIDARGRWHLDPGEGLVQSADQTRGMPAAGLGDAHQFVDPGRRVPRDALRLWEDTLAVRGPVVDGNAKLVAAGDGHLYAQIKPADGSDEVYVKVQGVPTVSTGLTPELIPGADRTVQTLPEALETVRERLPADSPLHARLAEAPTAQAALQVLGEDGALETLRADDGSRGALRTLDATAQWEHARAEAPGRVFIGDEIAENRFDPTAEGGPKTWLIAGAGGTGVANAEIILEADPEARVTIVGPNLPPALENQVQFNAMRERFEASHGGDGRLTINIDPANRVGAVQMHTGPDGKPRFREGNTEAEAYVGCLGRTFPLPGPLQDLGERTRSGGGQVNGDLMFDQDRLYVGYGLNFESGGQQHRVEVTGSASLLLPRGVFPPDTQQALTAMAVRQVPAQTGNAAVGFAPTATQTARLSEAREQGTVQRHSSVPESWRKPTTATTSASASASANSPSAPKTSAPNATTTTGGPTSGSTTTGPTATGPAATGPAATGPTANGPTATGPTTGPASVNPIARIARTRSGKGTAAPGGPSGPTGGGSAPAQPPRVPRPPQPGGGAPSR